MEIKDINERITSWVLGGMHCSGFAIACAIRNKSIQASGRTADTDNNDSAVDSTGTVV